MSGAHLKKQKVLFAPPQGFSIIELIVTMSMFVMISMALLFNYNTFSGHITLDTLSNQIALWIRDAQVEAMSVKVGAASGAYSGYGIHFDRATPDQFIFFADLNGNADYDAGGTCGDATSECVKVITLLKGNKISKLCGDITAVSARKVVPPSVERSIVLAFKR